MEGNLESWLIFGSLGLAIAFLVLRTLTRNPLIKKRLGLGAFILLCTVLFRLIDNLLVLEVRLADIKLVQDVHKLVVAFALILGLVALVFNRFRKAEVSDRFPSIVQDAIVIGAVALIGTLVAPDQLFAASAVGALVIGLALQDTLGNLFAGLALQVEKPFFVNDWIRIGSLEGRVTEVTWRATKIRTKSGQFCVIPNTIISKDVLVNFTNPSSVIRIDKVIGFGYEARPNMVKRVILETAAEIPGILKDPAPGVFLVNYGDFTIDYQCRFWMNDFGRADPIMDQFTTLLYYRIEREGLVIPFPIRDVRMRAEAPDPQAADRDHQQRLALIARVDLFSAFSPEQRQEVARCLERITFAANEYMIHQGDSGDWMIFIERGNARVVLERGGTVTPVAQLAEGEYVGEMALLTGEPRSASVIANRDVRAYILRKAAFRSVLLDDPGLAARLSEVIAARRAVLDSKAVELDSAARARHAEAAKDSLLRKIQGFFGL